MKSNVFQIPVFLILLFNLSSCSGIFRSYINKKYPPVSSVQRSIASTKTSIAALNVLPKAGLGVQIKGTALTALIDSFVKEKLMQDSTLGIKNVGQLSFVAPAIFSLAPQEMIATAEIRITDIQNKYVKEVDLTFTGRMSPSITGDTILLAPSFTSLHLNTLKLRKCIILGGLAKEAVNTLCISFMDNINGALNPFAVNVHYPPLPVAPLSQILGSDSTITVLVDDTFRLRPRKLNPVILIDTGHLKLLANIAIDTTIAPVAYLPKNHVRIKSSESDEFDRLFHIYDSLFSSTWTRYLDPLPLINPPTMFVSLSYGTMNEMMNELWTGANFSVRYPISIHNEIKKKEIILGQITPPDCSSIPFNYTGINCASQLSNCNGNCHLNPICYANYAACQAMNGVRWTACQAQNAVNLAWASANWVAGKALCYTEVAGAFVLNKLVLPVGTFQGDYTVIGNITGTLLKTKPGGIESIGFNATLDADIGTNVNLSFIPSGLAGIILCNLPTGINIHPHLNLNVPAFDINATMEKITNAGQPILHISTGKFSMPVQFQQPLILCLLQQPQLILSCSLGIFAGVAVAAFLALKGNEEFKNYLNAAFGGEYSLSMEQAINVPLPAIPLNTAYTHYTLSPSWGNNSLIYQNK